MQKLPKQTSNKADENFKKLAELFPSAVTESIVNGEVVRVIDKDMLMQEISSHVVEGVEERYQFTWPDKKKSLVLAHAPTKQTLRPVRSESLHFDSTENLYIEGDNLDALKLLHETYLNKVKMIYIDPPYNTGNDFVYEDDFKQSVEEYAEISGDYDEYGNRLEQNKDSKGRFHTDWLNMMYPRLRYARDLLSDDGVIFISIDDNEVHNLRKICDEIFGVSNFVAEFSIIRAEGGGLAKQVIKGHDYLCVYSKDINSFTPLGKVKDIRGKIIEKSGEKYWIQEDWLRKEFGKYGNCHYEEIEQYKGIDQKAEIDKKIEHGEYILIKKSNEMHIVGKLRKIKDDASKFYSILKHLSKNGVSDLESINLSSYFDYPKPISLLKEVILGATFFTSQKNDIILDFFSGSATTAHAVMQLNAEDGGNRKFIMVQIPEETPENSEARRAGYENICEIGKERIRRAGAKILQEQAAQAQATAQNETTQGNLLSTTEAAQQAKPLDVGFRVLRVDSGNFVEDIEQVPHATTQQTLMESVNNIKADRSAEDLLFNSMLRLGVPLSSKIEQVQIQDKQIFKVYHADTLYLAASFDDNLTDAIITEIAQMKPLYFAMRDASQESDSVATNFEEIFKLYSPSTKRWVL